MTSMKYLVLIVLSLTSFSSFAGGGGGGGVMASIISPEASLHGLELLAPEQSRKSPEIIFNLGQNENFVRFAYGQLIDKKWQIEKLEMPIDEATIDSALIKALQKSKDLNSWSEIR